MTGKKGFNKKVKKKILIKNSIYLFISCVAFKKNSFYHKILKCRNEKTRKEKKIVGEITKNYVILVKTNSNRRQAGKAATEAKSRDKKKNKIRY